MHNHVYIFEWRESAIKLRYECLLITHFGESNEYVGKVLET